MSRISVIDLTQLGRMDVLETLDVEVMLAARMTDLVTRWAANDPPAAATYDVENLEFDPLKINQEVSTYFEALVRDRVNQAARAVTLAFASGNDLDAIASRYPGGVPRLAIVANPRPYATFPLDWETDARYRRRIWASPNTLSPHGTADSYTFWALTADATLKDASVTTVEGTGRVYITIMASGDDPMPTIEQIAAVRTYILSEARHGITDIVIVGGPTITRTDYRIRVWLYPAVNATVTLAAINAALTALLAKQYWVGYDHSLMAINAACAQPGVHHVVIDEPTKDVNVGDKGLVVVDDVIVTLVGRAE